MSDSLRCLFAAIGTTGVLAIAAPVFAQFNQLTASPAIALSSAVMSKQSSTVLINAPSAIVSVEAQISGSQISDSQISDSQQNKDVGLSKAPQSAPVAEAESSRSPTINKISPCSSMQQ
jgi:hypothetical protein